MKKLTLFFTTSHKQGFVSWLIRLVQGTPFSHDALGLTIDDLGENIIYEANIGGVVCVEKENWLKSNKIVYVKDYHFEEEEYKELQKYCIQQLGKPYGYQNLIAILLNKTNVNDGDNSFICSELAYKVLKNQFPDLFKGQDYVTPKDLYKHITKK